jgi:2-oxo-4-hydroxy-4-carboxy-5-ureidoimidazoline decarboxylase
MFREASRIWWNDLTSKDWLQAFEAHPRIGDKEALRRKFQKAKGSQVWESGEQSGAANASEKILDELKDANQSYEKRYGFIFLVCATGKS